MKDYEQFYKLLGSTKITYNKVLLNMGIKWGIDLANAKLPGLNIIIQGISMLDDSPIQRYLIESGNQDIRSAMKMLRDDLYGDNAKAEIDRALTLLKRGRDTFFSAILAELNSPLNSLLSSEGMINSLTNALGFESPFIPNSVQDNFEKAFFSATLIALCYLVLNDNQKAESAFSDMRYFFYNRLLTSMGYDTKARLHEALQAIDNRKGVDISIMSRTSLDDAKSRYDAVQLEERYFIELCSDVFQKNIKKTIPTNYGTRTFEVGSRMPQLYMYVVSAVWNPPSLGSFRI